MSVLNEEEIQVLLEALDDEYKSYATYDQVIEDFGSIKPFLNIREAEGRHINALLGLFERYDISIPDNNWPGRVDRFISQEAACKAAVEAEIANGEMYDRLIRTTQKSEIIAVLRNLQEASLQRHLPAFQRCIQRCNGGRGG